MRNKCEHLDKDLGCLVSFDGSCSKEECFTYRLMQKLEYKEQECERLSKYSVGFAKKCQRLELDILHLKDENNRFKRELQPFNDDYFKDLDTKTIAELAKKSIRLTTENRKLENALDEIEEYINTQLDELAVNKIKDIINGAKDIKVPHKAKEEK